MPIPKIQNPFDWITQLWHMVVGRKVVRPEDDWLLGPIGAMGEQAEGFIARVAKEYSLSVKQNESGVGLVDSMTELGFSIRPEVEAFYSRTSDFELDAWTEWKPFFKPFGFLVGVIFSKRIQQLYLPMNSLETAQGIQSEIIRLVDANDRTTYRIWRRRLKQSKNTIFYGIYSDCELPSGKPGIKTIFPLPQGSATAVFEIQEGEHGDLHLISSGKAYGDPGFYVLVEDRLGVLYKHFMPYFRQQIDVYKDGEGILRADHTMSLYSFTVHNMHYKILEKKKGEACS